MYATFYRIDFQVVPVDNLDKKSRLVVVVVMYTSLQAEIMDSLSFFLNDFLSLSIREQYCDEPSRHENYFVPCNLASRWNDGYCTRG